MKTNEEWINHISTNVSIDGKTGCWNWKRLLEKMDMESLGIMELQIIYIV